jgi:hypothetical protein
MPLLLDSILQRSRNRIQYLLPEVAHPQRDTANFVDQGNSLQQSIEFRPFARALAFFDRDHAHAIFLAASASGRNDIFTSQIHRVLTESRKIEPKTQCLMPTAVTTNSILVAFAIARAPSNSFERRTASSRRDPRYLALAREAIDELLLAG